MFAQDNHFLFNDCLSLYHDFLCLLRLICNAALQPTEPNGEVLWLCGRMQLDIIYVFYEWTHLSYHYYYIISYLMCWKDTVQDAALRV